MTPSAPWSPRLWFGAAVYRGHMWVLGGWSKVPEQNWTRLEAKTTWKERHELPVFVHKDRLWVAGGHAKPFSNEVWSLRLPPGFPGKNRREQKAKKTLDDLPNFPHTEGE